MTQTAPRHLARGARVPTLLCTILTTMTNEAASAMLSVANGDQVVIKWRRPTTVRMPPRRAIRGGNQASWGKEMQLVVSKALTKTRVASAALSVARATAPRALSTTPLALRARVTQPSSTTPPAVTARATELHELAVRAPGHEPVNVHLPAAAWQSLPHPYGLDRGL